MAFSPPLIDITILTLIPLPIFNGLYIFFVYQAKSKGVSTTMVGAIFSIHPFCLFLVSLITGKYVSYDEAYLNYFG